MQKFLKEIAAFGKLHKCQTKYLGDGFIFIFELKSLKKKEKCFHKVLLALKELTKSMLKIIQSCSWPTPDGFRMRITGGWVDVYSVGNVPEYIGEAPNLARDLLYVAPDVEILIHSSVVKRLNQDQVKTLKITKFNGKKNNRRIEDEKLKELWEMPI